MFDEAHVGFLLLFCNNCSTFARICALYCFFFFSHFTILSGDPIPITGETKHGWMGDIEPFAAVG